MVEDEDDEEDEDAEGVDRHVEDDRRGDGFAREHVRVPEDDHQRTAQADGVEVVPPAGQLGRRVTHRTSIVIAEETSWTGPPFSDVRRRTR